MKHFYYNGKEYNYVREALNPTGKYTGYGDCLIRTIMRVLNRLNKEDWYEIYDDLYKLGLTKCKVFNSPEIIFLYMDDKNFEYKILSRDHIKVLDFLDTHRKGTYMIGIGRHIFAYIDGVIYDASEYNEFREKSNKYYFEISLVDEDILYYYKKGTD